MTTTTSVIADVAISSPPTKSRGRLEQLDSLRGLAALSVFFGHFAQLYPVMNEQAATVTMPVIAGALRYTPLSLLIAGHSAVLLFFVLSGLVLSLPMHRGLPPYREFAIKRICRIWLPYVVCIVLCLGIRLVTYTGAGFPSISNWFNHFIELSVSLRDVLGHLTLIGFFNSEKINLVSWSLVVEMRISLIFPLLFVLTNKLSKHSFIILALFLLVLPKVAQKLCHIEKINDLITTLGFIPCFMLGIAIAKYRTEIVAWWKRQHRMMHVAVLTLGVLCYTAPNLWSGVPHYQRYQIGVLITGLAVLGSCVFITAALSSSIVERFLRHRALVFLGQISYSFYLYHAVILMGVLNLTRAAIPMPIIFILSLAGAVLISALSYWFVELPSIALGKSLTSRLRAVPGESQAMQVR